MERRTHARRAARHIAATGAALARRFRADAELAAAATRVIAERAAILAEADLRAGAEVARMGVEKVSAATEAGTAAWIESFGAARLWLDLWVRQGARTAALVSASDIAATARIAEAMWADLLATGAATARLTAGVADAAIGPIHRVAVANARRLSA